MSKAVLKIEDVDVNMITFTKPRANKNNAGKTVYMSYDQKPVYIQTPKMNCPFGISKWDQSLPVKYNLEAFFPEDQVDELTKKFYELENKYIEHATTQSQDFFGKAKSRETIIDNYISSVKPSQFDEKEDKYGPRLKCKLEKNDFKFRTDVWDGNKNSGEGYEKLDFNEDNYSEVVPKGCKVQCILSITGWVVNGRFGLIYRIEQMIVFDSNKNVKLSGFSFVDKPQATQEASDDSEESEIELEPPKKKPVDSDSDDEPMVLVKEKKKTRGFSKV
jgi:hypothetical protein